MEKKSNPALSCTTQPISSNHLARWLGRLISSLVEPLGSLVRLLTGYLRALRLAQRIPGPKGLPVIGNVLNVESFNSRDICRFAVSLYQEYGSVFRFFLGPALLVHTSNPRDIEMVLSGYKFIDKSFIYKFMDPWLGTGLITSTGEKWRNRRKMLTPAFHFSILEQFLPVFHSCSDEFVRQLRKRAGGAAFDIWALVELLTLDIICETTMGVKINAQTDSHSKYVSAVKEITKLTASRTFQPWYYPDFIYFLSPSGRRYRKCLKVLHGHTEKVIKERRVELDSYSNERKTLDIDELGRKRRVAFLDLLLLSSRDGSLTDADIKDEVDTFMFAGHDTVTSALSFTLFLLSRHPDVQEKVLNEVESVFQEHQVLEPSSKDLSELKYLEMVIKESLRLYPPAAITFRHLKEDIQLECGAVVPAGSSLSTSPYPVHHCGDNFPNADEFLPERFLPEEAVRRHPFAFLPFSAGPRNCIGQRFAMLELKITLAKVIWNFRILPVPDFEPVLGLEVILRSINGIMVQVEDRRRANTATAQQPMN